MMGSILLLATILALIWSLTPAAAHDVTEDFIGSGYIHVLNNSNFERALPTDRIGCLNIYGMLDLNNHECAIFTRSDISPYTLSTTAGNCSFKNTDMPTNKDSVYGSDSHAWSCGGRGGEGLEEWYYTVNGFNHPFVCNGNFGCTKDIRAPSPDDGGLLPVWDYFWGSQQMGIPPGHLQVIWLWVPVSKKAEEGDGEE